MRQRYLDLAASLRDELAQIDGFISIEMFAAYRLRVTEVIRDYGMRDRAQVHQDNPA